MSNVGLEYQEYVDNDTAECCPASYLLPDIFVLAGKVGSQTRLLDIGCGNG